MLSVSGIKGKSNCVRVLEKKNYRRPDRSDIEDLIGELLHPTPASEDFHSEWIKKYVGFPCLCVREGLKPFL